MKVISPNFLSLTVIVFMYCGIMNAQKTVLVNGEATLVTLSNNDIASVKGSKANHMSGYAQPSSDIYKKVKPRIGNSVPSTRTIPAPVSNTKEPLMRNTESVSFADGNSDVSAEAKKYLNSVAKSVKSGEVKTILLKTWYKSGDTDNISLTRRRLDSCKRFLESKGVVSNLILTSMVAKSKSSSEIAVLKK